ncbi:hypothetical protein HXX76_007743 [Chlamydomonas incerta]|uniref:Uncharacterized protein n=1 Tax=Chlamydomonas incerta TaxID=51695 RepID=A0A835W0L7_CHLIN|nr:hypothetical protein HXX76_007743 [Chlamydomonas incerta]|eukprot:KAG2434860.1 hypothetical protein HXX76_007743 [Chlamydomonas incerta]
MSSPAVCDDIGSVGGVPLNVAAWTCAIPQGVLALVAEANEQKPITETEPFLILEINEPALILRQPAFAGCDVSKAAIAAVVAAHMTEVTDIDNRPSRLIFRETFRQMVLAFNDLAWTPWTRWVAGLPDVGKLFYAVSTTEVFAVANPFHS